MLRVCLNFLAAYILATIALIALSYAIDAFFGTDIGSAVNIVPQLAGALYAGQMYGKRTGQPPENGFAWSAAICMTLTSVGFSLVILGGAIIVFGTAVTAPFSDLIDQLPMSWIIGIVLVLLIIYTLASRYFFGMGAKNQIKAMDKDVQGRF